MPAVFSFTLPLLLGYLLQQTYQIIDAAIVGQFLGIEALASVGVSNSVTFLILGFCNGCTIGFGIPVAQKFGARDYSSLRRLVSNSLRLAVYMSVAIATVTCFLCSEILQMLNTPGSIFPNAFNYLFITFLGVPCTFFYNLVSSIVRALGDSKTPFYVLLISAVLNILLDLFFILVLELGVAGAAIATILSQGVSALLCYLYMMKRFDILRATREERKHSRRLCSQLLGIGVPMGLQFSITAIGCIMLQSAANGLGAKYVATLATTSRINAFFMCPFESLGMAMATFAGQNYGAGRLDRVRAGVRAGGLITAAYSVCFITTLWLFSENLALLFVEPGQTEIIGYVARFLHTECCFYPLLGMLCVWRYVIQGVGYTNLAMFSGVAELVARGGVALWAVPALGFTAVCFGNGFAWICADLFLLPAYLWVYKKCVLRISVQS